MSQVDAARTFLKEVAVPTAKDHGAKTAYWLAPQHGRGIAITVFDSEEDANAAADTLEVELKPDQIR